MPSRSSLEGPTDADGVMEEAMVRLALLVPTFKLAPSAALAKRLVATLTVWHHRARQRRHLAGLDDMLLKDIGLTRCDAEMEAAKPFWRG
jgi:uncharacterized protein YjiS (DUF1127 family)